MELLIGLVELFCFFMGAQIEINEVDVPIIMYHHIVDAEEPLNDFTVSSTKFDSDMNDLKENGYTAISYEELYDFVYNNGELPDKPIIITFDDGYESNYKYAYPTLKNLNMKATISIIVSMVGKDTYKGRQAFKHFSYDDAKEMYDSGLIDIQTHTYSLHDLSARVGVKRKENEDEFEYIYTIKNDIKKSTAEITSHLNNRQFVFTYPYGAYDYLTEQIMKELGFAITVTTDPGINHIIRGDKESLYKLKRFDIKNDTDVVGLLSDYANFDLTR